MSAIYRKEMKVYMSGMFGYFMMAILLLFMGVFVALFNLLAASADFSYPLAAMQWVLIVIIPFLTMRSIAEERHSRTDQLLYSLPMPMRDIVIGKFLAILSVFLIPTLVSALYPLLLASMGNVSLPAAYTALLGYILMGTALISVSMFVSSLVENQILAAVLSMVTVLLFYFLDYAAALVPTAPLVSFLICILAEIGIAAILWAVTKNFNLGLAAALLLVVPTAVIYIVNAELFRALVPDFLTAVDLFTRFSGFSYGHFDIPGVVFYLTFTGFFLFLTVQSMEKRRLS